VRANVVVGKDFRFGDHSTFWAPNSLKIGDEVSVGSYSRIEADGILGNRVLIASHVGIVGRRDHAIHEIGIPITKSTWVGDEPKLSTENVIIHDDVWIGYGAIILTGVTIGQSSIVAAGSVVTRDVPENVIVAGNPAKVIRARFSSEDFERHVSELKHWR
jgi:acetyltransferase-like isoleucine patch superfamily enzyme